MSTDDGQHRRSLATYTGLRGAATRLALDPALPGADTTICWYLLEGNWHPIWNQFLLFCVHLREQEGAPPAKLKFPDATHEVMVVALNPERGRRTPSDLETNGVGPQAFLTPYDWVEQFQATDAEMDELVGLLARGAADGMLNPSTDDARERLREHWLRSAVRTLAHMRGEVHHA